METRSFVSRFHFNFDSIRVTGRWSSGLTIVAEQQDITNLALVLSGCLAVFLVKLFLRSIRDQFSLLGNKKTESATFKLVKRLIRNPPIPITRERNCAYMIVHASRWAIDAAVRGRVRDHFFVWTPLFGGHCRPLGTRMQRHL